MPKVGSRYFSYNKKGKAAARRYARRKGLKLRMHSKVSRRGMKY